MSLIVVWTPEPFLNTHIKTKTYYIKILEEFLEQFLDESQVDFLFEILG